MTRRKSGTSRRSRATLQLPRIPRIASTARQREVLGALLVALAVITILAFVSQGGAFTDRWTAALRWLLGWAAPVSPLVVGGLGVWLIVDGMDGRADVRWSRPIGGLVAFAAMVALVHLVAEAVDAAATLRSLAEGAAGGGWLGYGLSAPLAANLGRVPAGALLLIAVGVGATLAADRTIGEALLALRTGLAGLGDGVARTWRARSSRRDGTRVAAPPPELPAERPVPPAREREAIPAAATTPGAERHPPGADGSRDWHLPALDEVLDPAAVAEGRPDDAEATARTIEQALGEFGVPARVVKINRGPTITQFGLEPGYVERAGKRERVKVSRIVSLQNDLALALSASPIRIQAPVPGRPYVGVEVPNASSSLVSLRDVLESEAFARVASTGALPIALGRDTSGRPVAADLAAMPHLLVAGATGSGKSVAMNAIICTLLMTHTPASLKMLLVDPKRVELVQYRGLPHLAAPVVVDIERVIGVLQWVVREMDRRYRAFAEEGVRNLATYNAAMRQKGRASLPCLVLFIDELADLMMVAPEEAERLITRIAQLARATGIHLVLATQRPSVDVVTGLIKANFPSRIAFAVSSGVDSRVILDTVGAEKLLGRGDMLYQASDASRLQRLQGCYVADAEIERICRFWRRAASSEGQAPDTSLTLGLPEPLIQPELWEEMVATRADRDRERDPLWEEAVALIGQHNTASTSFLQRKLRVGYSRAARILDQLEEAGLVGPAHGNAPREVHAGAGASAADVDVGGTDKVTPSGDEEKGGEPWTA